MMSAAATTAVTAVAGATFDGRATFHGWAAVTSLGGRGQGIGFHEVVDRFMFIRDGFCVRRNGWQWQALRIVGHLMADLDRSHHTIGLVGLQSRG